jgi:hypothetical protein
MSRDEELRGDGAGNLFFVVNSRSGGEITSRKQEPKLCQSGFSEMSLYSDDGIPISSLFEARPDMGLLRPVNQSDHVRAFDLMRFKPRFRLHKRIIPL